MMGLSALPRTLMGSTKAMRKAGQAYLPQEKAESDDAYKIRLSRSTLFNGFGKTVEDMTGRVFAKDIVLGEDVPELLSKAAENVDLAGRHLNVFAKDVFSDALVTGIGYILVDMPAASEGATKADEQRQGIRPYFCYIPLESLIGWQSGNIEGQQVLTQIRIAETVEEDDPDNPWEPMSVKQVRVVTVQDSIQVADNQSNGFASGAKWEVYRPTEDKGEEWVLHDYGYTSLNKITLAPVYINRTGFMEGAPPLEDLADLNVAHWQSQSDQRNILHVARVPILFGAGLSSDDQKNIQIGASSMTLSTDPNGKLEYVEHTGAAIESGRQDIKDLEFQMQAMGLQLLVDQTGRTATGEKRDDTKENSRLGAMVTGLKDALEMAFGFAAEYMGLGFDAGGSVEPNRDFGITLAGADDIRMLMEQEKAGQISRPTFWKEVKRRGFYADDFSPDDEADIIGDQGPELGMIGIDQERVAAE